MNDFSKTTHVHTTYEVNGVRYERLENIPEEARRLITDANRDGVPDVIEDILKKAPPGAHTDVTTVRVERQFVSHDAQGMTEMARHHLLSDKSRPVRIRCTECKYDLAGTPVGGKCPECGMEVAASILKLTEPSRWSAIPRTGASGRFTRLLATIPLVVIALFIVAVRQCSS